jgi:hypothetical protein
MATTKKRINVSLPEDIENALLSLAERDDMPAATKALHLIKLALEIEEDDILNALAESRDVRGSKFVSHKDAWL